MRASSLLTIIILAVAGCLAPQTVPDDSEDGKEQTIGGFSPTAVYAGSYDTSKELRFSKVLSEGPLKLLPDELQVIKSQIDGADLQIGISRPDTTEPVPVIAFGSPYLAPLQTLEYRTRLARLTENFGSHGYAVALVPIRGTADNGGCMDLMGPSERADLDQAITWLGEQPWSNGNVGMVGVSYDGSTPWEVASLGNIHLKTIVPISGVNDIYDLMFRNGSAESRGPLLLNALYYQYGFIEYNVAEGRSAQHSVEGVVCPESLKGFEAAMYSGFVGERDKTGFWAARNSRPGVEEKYRGSILMVHGLQDWNVDPHHAYPWTNQLEAKGIIVKHLLGQWPHAWPDSGIYAPNGEPSPHARYDWAEILLHWFDYWLKEDLTADLGPVAQVEDSQGQWRNEDSWPPDDAAPVKYQLSGDGTLVLEGASEGSVVAGVEPALTQMDPTGCELCASFATEPFTTDFRFAGTPHLHVAVTPSGPGGHLTAFLYSEKEGERQRIGWGWMDLRFAEGGETMKPVVPGETITARMEIEPLDAIVPEGAKLVVVIHQGTNGDRLPSLTPAPVHVETGGDKSTLTIEAFERTADVFFQPPRPK